MPVLMVGTSEPAVGPSTHHAVGEHGFQELEVRGRAADAVRDGLSGDACVAAQHETEPTAHHRTLPLIRNTAAFKYRRG